MRDKAESVNETLVKALVETNAQLLKSNKRLTDAALALSEQQLERIRWELATEQAAAVGSAQRAPDQQPRVDKPSPDDGYEVPFGEDDVT